MSTDTSLVVIVMPSAWAYEEKKTEKMVIADKSNARRLTLKNLAQNTLQKLLYAYDYTIL